MTHLAVSVALSALVTAGSLLAYDRLVVKPAQVIGVVDIAEIYRLNEAKFTGLMSAGKSAEEHQKAMDVAIRFAQRLPDAMDEVAVDCRCLVVAQTALAGRSPRTRDLTPLLKAKLDLK